MVSSPSVRKKNVIAIECVDVGAVQYQLFWKNDKEATPIIIYLAHEQLKIYKQNLPYIH